jgi:small subunit ribosomal protein S19
MTRAIWKGPFVKAGLLSAIARDVQREGVKTKSRASMVLPSMVGANVHVHNGHQYIPLMLSEEMIGRRLGEFVATKKPFSFRATNANKKPKK